MSIDPNHSADFNSAINLNPLKLFVDASWQAIEAGEPLAHVSEVTGATPAEAAQAFADRLLSQRLGNQRVIESEIRVRAPGQRIWQKFSVRLVALVEPKRSPGCCHPEVSDGR